MFRRPTPAPVNRTPPPFAETSFADPCSPSMCREPGCPHVSDDDGTGPPPTMFWRSQGCMYAWCFEQNKLAQQRQVAS